jgi:hypothetical protein
LVPQEETAVVAQRPWGSFEPLATVEQVPSLPDRLQAWQVVVQALLQQTPWAQKPLWQSLLALQLAPRTLGPHEPLVQKFPATH